MSEQTLDQLIQRLKSEAIAKAEKESSEILAEARAQAERMLAEAEEDKRSILQQAEKEARETVEKGKSALQVAARDLSLSLRNDLLSMLQATLEREVEKQFEPDLMKTVIARVVEQLGSEVAFRLPDDHAEELAAYIHQQFLASENGITMLDGHTASAGISITKKDEGWSYDISPEQVTEAILPHLNPKWAQILSPTTEA